VQRYFFDLTATVWHLKRMPYFSGIQRAVVMMIEGFAAQVGTENVHLSYYDKVSRKYLSFPLSALGPDDLTDAESLRHRLGYRRVAIDIHPSLRGYRDRPLKLFFHKTIAWLNAAVGRDRYFTRRNTTRKDWRAYHHTGVLRSAKLPTVSFTEVAREGDHLLLLDGTFTVSSATASFQAAQTSGLTVHTMIHDLIPVSAPKLVPAINRLTFHDWLRETETYTSHYLANSEATQRDLSKFLETYDIKRSVDVVRLAQARLPSRPAEDLGPLLAKVDLGVYPELAATSIDERLQAITSYPFVLCVGTLEVRKNIWRLASVWDRLRLVEGVPLPKLVFAGRPGWMKDDFDNLLRATGNIYGWVEIIASPSDDDLAHLYRNCLFLAMPSLYEGWGLPLGEALSYGKTAVVSNTSSLPEVGRDLVEYCDPTSIDSIAEACLRLIKDREHRTNLEQKIRGTNLRSWDDVAKDLVLVIARS
jgi:glycosyltransferase involved in cell wall biosynthesis